MIKKLVLGTAQLGMPYGVSNKTGKPDFQSALSTVRTAFEAGIVRLDTAQAYGDSEAVLGKIFSSLKIRDRVKVYSKLHPDLDLNGPRNLMDSVDASLERLQIGSLEGLMFHREEALDSWNDVLRNVLLDLVRKGKVRKIGMSFYSPDCALKALDLEEISFIQVPANILDRRFKDQGVFKKASDNHKQVFIRSVFLQGLLLMPFHDIPDRMDFARDAVKQFHDLSEKLGVTCQQLAINHIRSFYPDCFFVIGAETPAQIAENSRLFQQPNTTGSCETPFLNIPEKIVNPVFWPRPAEVASHE